jgi:hypothetical protein
MSDKSQQEIDELKAAWVSDPCWDIEDTPGFEAQYDELRAYRAEQEAAWAADWARQVRVRAERLGIPDHRELADYLLRLEMRVATLEERLRSSMSSRCSE